MLETLGTDSSHSQTHATIRIKVKARAPTKACSGSSDYREGQHMIIADNVGRCHGDGKYELQFGIRM